MDWETILTSSVIAAIVAGIIELFKLNNSNKATFVIKQREEWREKIRTIIDDIYKADPSNIGVSLTMLKTRINAYGKVNVNLSKTTEDDKRKFYLKDGHIHKTIQDLEQIDNLLTFNNNKLKLIGYLELMLKFDWERSKKESSTNNLFVCSLVIELISIIMLAIKSPQEVKDIIPLILMLLSYFAAPILIYIMLKEGNDTAKLRKTALRSYITILVFVAILAIVMYFLKPEIFFPMLLMVLAYIVLIASISNNDKHIKDYIETIIKYEEVLSKEHTNNPIPSKVKIKDTSSKWGFKKVISIKK